MMCINVLMLAAFLIDTMSTYEYNSTMPLPPVMMAKNANLSKPRLVIPFFVEFHQMTMMYVPLQTQLILDTVKPITPYLQDFELEINLYDTLCADPPTVNATMTILEEGSRNLPFIGSYACSMKGQKLYAEVINHYNYVAIGLLDVVHDSIIDRKRFRNYFTLGATIDEMQDAMLNFIKTQKWKRLALFGENELVYYVEWNRVLLSKLAQNKIDLIWYEPVPYIMNYNDEDWQHAMDSLIVVDPRIIIYNGESGYAALCWFARYKLYGPNYAFILIHWVDTNAETIVIPDYISHWCTVDMVRLSMKNSFIYGEIPKATLSPNERDDLNLTGIGMEKQLLRIQDIENIVWMHNKYSFYDPLLFTCSMLNKAEHLLRRQNDSLVNWSVGSEKFKQNGSHIVNIMKEAIFSTRVSGLRGDYQFFRNTSLNSGGGTPTPIFQCIPEENSNAINMPVVFYGNRLGPHALVWQDGYPPYDKVQLVKYQVRAYPVEAVSILSVLNALVLLLLIAITFVKRKTITWQKVILLFGIAVSACSVFLFELLDSEPIAFHCSIVATLICFGVSLQLAGLGMVLDRELKQLENFSARIRAIAAIKRETVAEAPAIAESKWKKLAVAVLLCGFIALAAIFISAEPFDAFKNEATPQMTFGKRHVELAVHVDCKLALGTLAIVIISIAVGIVLLIVLQSSLIAYKIVVAKKATKSKLKSSKSSSAQTMTAVSLNPPKDSAALQIVCVTLGIGSILLVLINGLFAAYVAAALSILMGMAVSLDFWFDKKGVEP